MGDFFSGIGDVMATSGGADSWGGASALQKLQGLNNMNNAFSSNPTQNNMSQLQSGNNMLSELIERLSRKKGVVNTKFQLPTTVNPQYTWLPNATQDKYSKYLNGFGG